MPAAPARAQPLLLELVQARDEVNGLASKLNRGDLGRAEVFRPLPTGFRLAPPELGFTRLVSWLYVLYQEAGRVNVRFLLRYADTYSLDANGSIRAHYHDIQRLRTYLNHYLNPERERDVAIMEASEAWFRTRTGTVQPTSDESWERALVNLLEEAIRFLRLLEACLRAIECDEACEMVVGEWHRERERSTPPEAFDPIIARTVEDFGRSHLDILAFRKRFYAKWSDELQLMALPYDFAIEARKLIEHSLLHETTPVLPITGTDIITQFDLQPGPLIGVMISRARVLYDGAPCTGAELIARLRDDEVAKDLLTTR